MSVENFATVATAENPLFVWATDRTAAKALIRLGLYIHDHWGEDPTLTGVNVYFADGGFIAEAGVCV